MDLAWVAPRNAGPAGEGPRVMWLGVLLVLWCIGAAAFLSLEGEIRRQERRIERLYRRLDKRLDRLEGGQDD
jgi:hypothetical protein